MSRMQWLAGRPPRLASHAGAGSNGSQTAHSASLMSGDSGERDCCGKPRPGSTGTTLGSGGHHDWRQGRTARKAPGIALASTPKRLLGASYVMSATHRATPGKIQIRPGRRQPGSQAGSYRWLNPPDSCLVMDTVTGCLPKWATASRKSSRSRSAMSWLTPSRTRMRWTAMSEAVPVRV
jgi:hypothetical protein